MATGATLCQRTLVPGVAHEDAGRVHRLGPFVDVLERCPVFSKGRDVEGDRDGLCQVSWNVDAAAYLQTQWLGDDGERAACAHAMLVAMVEMVMTLASAMMRKAPSNPALPTARPCVGT